MAATVTRLAYTRVLLDGAETTILVENGAVAGIGPAAPAPPTTAVVDCDGLLVLPAAVDAHVHLDKAFQLDRAAAAGAFDGGGLADALRATAAVRAQLTADDMQRAIAGGLRRLMDGGTAAARIHVEIDAPDALDVLAAHVEALAHVPGFDAQLVAFAQNGITGEPGVLSRMCAALDGAAQVVGGCPYTDRDPLRHLDTVAGLAAERGAPLDLHIDLGDDPADSLLGPAIEAVARHGLSGRTTFGHVSTLAAMPHRQAAVAARRLRDAGVAVVAIPTTDLWLAGRGDVPSRGVTRMAVLRDNGVDVALASNNHVNAFTPISPASLLHVAQLASVACHLGSPEEQRALLDAVTRVPARIVGSDVPDAPLVGAPATFMLVDAPDPVTAVRLAAPVAGVVVRGELHEPVRRRPRRSEPARRTEPERWTR